MKNNKELVKNALTDKWQGVTHIMKKTKLHSYAIHPELIKLQDEGVLEAFKFGCYMRYRLKNASASSVQTQGEQI